MEGASRSPPARPSGKAEVNKVEGQIKDNKTETRLVRDRTKNGEQRKEVTVKSRQVQNRDKGDGASGNNNRTETKQAQDKTVTKIAQDRTKDGARGKKDKTIDAGQVLHQDQAKVKARQVIQEENKAEVEQKQNGNTAANVSQVKDENLNKVAHVEGREVNEDGQVEDEKGVMEVRNGVNAEAVVNSRVDNDAGEVKNDVGKVQENSTLGVGKDKTSDDLGEVKDHQSDRPAISDQLNHDSELVNDARGDSVQGSNGTSGGEQVIVSKAEQQPGQVGENLNNGARKYIRKVALGQLMSDIELAQEQPAGGDLVREKTTEVKDTLGDSPHVDNKDTELRETNSYLIQEEQEVDEKTRKENQWQYEASEAEQDTDTRTNEQETEKQIDRNVAHEANNSDKNEVTGQAETTKENMNIRRKISNEHHNRHMATKKTDETKTATKTRIRHKQDKSKGRQYDKDDEKSDDLDCGDLLVVDNELVRHLLPHMSPVLLPKAAKPRSKVLYSSCAPSKEHKQDKETSLNIIQESSENEENEESENSDQDLPARPPPASLPSLRRHSFHHFPAPPPESGSKKAEKVRALLQAVEEEELEKISKKIKQGANLVRQHLGHVEDRLFDMFGDREKRSININKFLMGLTATGMRPSDPRLKQTRDNLRKLQDNLGSEFVSLEVDYDTFMSIISENLEVVVRAFSASFVIPDFQGFCRQIEEIYNKCYANHSGKSAQYIPQLARFDSKSWGVSVCTVDGQRFSLGDVEVPFTIQSCSKPLTYGIGLAVNGTEYMHKYIGMEPSGRYFNDLVLDYDNKPHNPMINSGAIMTAAIIKPELSAADRFDFMFKVYKRLAGDEHLGFNNSVFLSERECADRNFALAYFMRENKCFPVNHKLHESLDFYFQLCSLEITAESGAVMAATLANGGLNPLTGDPVLTVDAVRNTLTLMHSCGMYNYSGQFSFHVGLPAKSGVSGCVLLVIPNTMGICLWSPPLDSNGNSCRGVQFCMEMVSRFNFHNFDNLRGYAKSKKDPRTAKTESKAQIIFDLLFSSAAGDMSALRRHSLAGTDMQAKDYDGRTALHVATSEGHHEIVEFLLKKCQVDPLPKDRWDRTPLDDAESFDHPTCVKLITECCKKKGITLPISYNECMALKKQSNGPLLEIDSL